MRKSLLRPVYNGKGGVGVSSHDPAEYRHLRGTETIMEIFGVSRRTVREWARRGAPINMVGRKYQASYHELWGWVAGNSENLRKNVKAVKNAHRVPEECLEYASQSGAENEWYVVLPCMDISNFYPDRREHEPELSGQSFKNS